MKQLFLRILTDIKSWLAGENKKYDTLKEPKRFFIGMGLTMSPILLFQLFGLFANNRSYNILAIIWIILIISMRIWWLEGNLKKYIKEYYDK